MLNEATQDFIREHRDDDVRALALRTLSRPDIDLTAALQQIEGRQLARRKLPEWGVREGLWFPPRLGMEQCSSEAAARYKRKVVEALLQREETVGTDRARVLTDLTGGFGVDFAYLAPLFRRAVYVERIPHLCRLAAHNFEQLSLTGAEVVNGDGVEYLRTMSSVDVLFVDPARRDGLGRKTVMPADCEPDVEALQTLLREKGRHIIIKLSPMLDVQAALQRLQGITEVHIVSVEGECKEMLLTMQRQPETTDVRIRCVNLSDKEAENSSFAFTPQEEAQAICPYAGAPSTYLYEPGAALLKAQAYRLPAVRYGLHKLHPNSHLYTSEQRIDNFPGRVFRVEASSGFGKKELKQLLKGYTQANLTVRNFPATTAELRKRLRLTDGGGTYLFATTVADGRHLLIRCVKPE